MEIKINLILVENRKRKLNSEKVVGLADSFALIGQLEPITVTLDNEHYVLLAGWHRLEAAKSLGWKTVKAEVFQGDALECELVEIDENLTNHDLTVLEQSIQLKRRNEILEEMGIRAKQGDNQHSLGSEIVSPPKTTEDIAKEAGLSKRSTQQRMQIARDLSPEVKELVQDTPIADSTTQLLELARLEPTEQVEAAQQIVDGKKTIDGYKKKKKQEELKQKKKELVTSLNELQPVVDQCDAIEWLSKQDRCDLLLTDPPYMTDIQNIEEFSRKWLPLALDKVKDTGRAYVCIGPYPRELKAYLDITPPDHLVLANILVWTYRNTIGPSPSLDYKNNWQAVLYYHGINAPALNCPIMIEQFSVQDISAPDGRHGTRFHKWQKPDELGQRFVSHGSKEGDLVLDPFSGTGTFLIEAGKLGVVAKGCEIDIEMLKISEDRGCKVVRK